MSVHKISSKNISLAELEKIYKQSAKLELSTEAKKKIAKSRKYLDQKMKSGKEVIYGINTGFGALHNQVVDNKNLEKLQYNLILSHACGTGDEVPAEIVRLMLLLKAQGFAHGLSGVQVDTVEFLINLYNADALPRIYKLGSLGASGDLAPLAHMALPLIGLGEVRYKGKVTTSKELLKKLKLQPIALQSKEGLALLNGTQFMCAYAVWNLWKADHLSQMADLIAALSLDAFDGRIDAFDERVHEIRKHKGQLKTAKRIRSLLKGSQLINAKKKHTQDPYSFRCVPQVHGASKDTINYLRTVVENEVNSVTDNPTIFPEDDTIISAGNFHGEPLALALDFMCIAMSEIGNISERRTYRLISGERQLPPFLVNEPGLNSGFMIPQYTAASIVSQNKQLCTPASVDSISSSNEQEDHVSMGANAATKCYRVMENVEKILAIELFTAAQALDFRKPKKSSKKIEALMKAYRKEVPFIKNDIMMQPEMDKSIRFIREFEIDL